MNLAPHDLSRHLKQSKTFSPVYLITGDEILLVEESIALIAAAARATGYDEHIVIDAEASQATDLFLSHQQNYSLFSSKKIIELRFRQKISAAFTALLTALPDDPDLILLLRMPKLSKAETQLKWYKTLEQKNACIITIWPLKQDAFLRWIKARVEQRGLKTSEAAYIAIAQCTEGNVLAAAQIIEKLQLLYADSPEIALENVQQCLSDESHYDVFELCDAILAQNTAKALKIMNTLQKQHVEPPIVLWAILQDFRKLVQLFSAIPAQRAGLYPKLGIWSTRQGLFQKALQTFNAQKMRRLMQNAEQADRRIKGADSGDAWIVLREMLLS